MTSQKDPTTVLRKAAASLPDVSEGTSCSQTSFKAGKSAFLYIGPGPKGIGFKAMFKLDTSIDEAKERAKGEPERFELGTGNWVTTRFTAEKPLPKKIWSRWLEESYAVATRGGGAKKKAPRKKA